MIHYFFNVVTLLAIAISPSLATAGIVIAPISGDRTGAGSVSSLNPISNIWANDGIPPYVVGLTDFDSYLPSQPNTTSEAYAIRDFDSTSTLTFDLGAVYTITGFGLGRGVDTLGNVTTGDLRFSETGVFGGPPLTTFSFSHTGSSTVQHAFTEIDARFVEFTNFTNGGASFARFDELWFDAVAVPEPSSLTMVGLACIAGLSRRRRRITKR